MAIKIIHIADIHVGMGFSTASFGRELGKERRRELKSSVLRVAERCEAMGVDLLLIAGDLFEDAHVTLSELMDLNHGFSKLTKTKVLIGAGNHDPIINKNSNYRLIDWCPQVHIYNTAMESYTIEEIGTCVHSFSWNQIYLPAFKKEVIEPLDSNYINILMLHGDVYQQNDYLYIDPKVLKTLAFDYIALGHIHKYDFIEPWIAYPGSLEPLDFSEVGQHGLIEGSLDKKNCDLRFQSFSQREFHILNLEVDGTRAYEEVKTMISNALDSIPDHDMVRVKLIGLLGANVDLDLQELKSYLQNKQHYVEIQDHTTPDLDLEQLENDYENTLIGAFIQYMRQKGLEDPVVEKALYEGLKILLEEQVKL